MHKGEPNAERRVSGGGWQFAGGSEPEASGNDADNLGIGSLYAIHNHGLNIMPLLRAPYGLALAKNENEDRVQEVVRGTKNSENMHRNIRRWLNNENR